jgi:hypothetical protein
MPGAKRRKLGVRRLGVMTLSQREHLECGDYLLWHRPEEEFLDDEHRRLTWAANRVQILAEWSRAGRRPAAFWELDCGFKPRLWPKCWSWPRRVETEPEMVRALLLAGDIEGCRLDGTMRIASEVEVIERSWLDEIRISLIGSQRVLEPSRLLSTWGTPAWFYREHAPRILAELEAEREAWRLRLPAGALERSKR